MKVFIEEDLLDALLEASKRKYPNEFFSLLGGEVHGDIVKVKEIIYIPWKEGRTHAIVDINAVPWDVVGSFHSHPGPPIPSSSDVGSFPWFGIVHIIAGYPFDRENVKAYDVNGREVEIILGQRASF